MDMLGVTEKLANAIIRPPRVNYSPATLGEPLFQFQDKIYERLDFDVPSYNQVTLKCSMYKEKSVVISRPTIIYLHANSSSRVSANTYIKQLIGQFDIVSFDFRGCGLSDGAYITLGYLEKEDVRAIIDFINKQFGRRVFMLWGRSMGAVTALLYAAKYRGICAVVADSPFSDLQKVIHSMSQKIFPLLPQFFVDAVIDNLSDFTEERIGQEYKKKYKIRRLKPIDCVHRITVPVFFIASKEDQLVDCKQIIQLYEATNSFKQLEVLQGGHNEVRPTHLKETISEFLMASIKMYKCAQPQRKRIFSYASTKPPLEKDLQFHSPLQPQMKKQLENDANFDGLEQKAEEQEKQGKLDKSFTQFRAGIFRRQHS